MITEEQVYAGLSTVIDPEVGFDIVALGLIYGVKITEKHVDVNMTLSTRACPLHELLKQWARESVEKVDGVESCEITIVWEPEWNITMANDTVKKALGG